MNQRVVLAASILLAVGLTGLVRAQAPAQGGVQDQPQAGKYTPGTLPPGIQKSESDSSKSIHRALGGLTKAAITKDDYSDIVDYFVDADRNRLNKWSEQKMDQNLANTLNQFRQAWKQKYNQDFDPDNEVVFGSGFQGFVIAQGEIQNPAMLSNWPVSNEGAQQGERGRQLDVTDRPGNRPGDRNLEKGRNVAVVSFPEAKDQKLQQLHVSMISEAFGWKIDVPDNLTGEQLQKALTEHFQHIAQMQNQWPNDVNQAYRIVSHHVLAAIYGIPTEKGGMDMGGAQR